MNKSIFLSDLHLGSTFNKSEKLFKLLESIEVQNIFLIGDIIHASTNKEHPDIVRFITLLDSKSWNIFYISGNHEDDKKNPTLSLSFEENLFPIESYIYSNTKERVYLEHGHSFHKKDKFNIFLETFFLYLRFKLFKRKRVKKDKKIANSSETRTIYYRFIKPLVKKIFKSSFEKYMVSLAKRDSCSVVICGHIHAPNDAVVKNIRYLNCGDWVENSSFIIENMNGEFSLKFS